MKTTIKLITLFLLAGIVLVSCKSSSSTDETSDVSFPFITENGVEPFLLGASLKDIPCHGEYYDTIVLNTLYLVSGVMPGEVYEWNEQQMEEYKREHEEYNVSGWAYNKIINTHTNCYVIYKKDTIMKVICDSDLKILCIKVFSEKLQFENGIHVGLTSSEMFSQFQAEYACEKDTRCMGNTAPPTMGYITQGMPNTIGLIAAKNNDITFDESEKYNDYLPIYPVHGTERNDGIWVMPLDDVKNDYLKCIIIVKDAYPELYNIRNDFYNSILEY